MFSVIALVVGVLFLPTIWKRGPAGEHTFSVIALVVGVLFLSALWKCGPTGEHVFSVIALVFGGGCVCVFAKQLRR